MTNIGKIELRDTHDGFWTASYRLPDHQEAMEVARIRMSLVETSESSREAFKKILTDAIGRLIAEAGGRNMTWNEMVADG